MVKWEKGGRGRKWGAKGEGTKGREMGMQEKKTKNATYLAFGEALWGLPPHVIESYFQ